jgi:hypothetical protein
MSQDWTEDEIRQTVNALIRKASQDAALRTLALKDPNAAIKQVTGKDIPEGLKINLLDEGAGKDLNAVLHLGAPNAELSDDELATLAAAGAGCPCGRTNVLNIKRK